MRRRIRAAQLLFLAGDVHRSLEQLEVLDPSGLTTPDLERALPLLLDMTELVHGADAATAIVTRAVREAGADPRRRALVLALASDVAYGIRGRRREAAEESVRDAEAAGPAADASLHRALINLLVAKVTAGDGLDRRLLDRAERIEARVHIDRLHDTAELHRGLWSRYVEDPDGARAALRRCITRAREAGDDFALATFCGYLAATEELAGDYAAASEALAAGDVAARWHDWPRLPWRLEPRCELLIASGQLDAAARLADQDLPDSADTPAAARFLGAVVRGQVWAWRGDSAAAVRHFERAAECADECEYADPGVRQGLDAALAEEYILEGRTDDARRIAARLRDIGARLGRPGVTGAAHRIDGLAAAQAGDLDGAAQLARQAVAAHEPSPLRPELARSLLTLGQIERRRRARHESRVALSRAADLARDMGHRPLLARIEGELPRVAAERTGDQLTVTEQRVAQLIADGATNREAAAALFVSVRTIETHVAAIYRKLHVRTRAQLARRLSQESAR